MSTLLEIVHYIHEMYITSVYNLHYLRFTCINNYLIAQRKNYFFTKHLF